MATTMQVNQAISDGDDLNSGASFNKIIRSKVSNINGNGDSNDTMQAAEITVEGTRNSQDLMMVIEELNSPVEMTIKDNEIHRENYTSR